MPYFQRAAAGRRLGVATGLRRNPIPAPGLLWPHSQPPLHRQRGLLFALLKNHVLFVQGLGSLDKNARACIYFPLATDNEVCKGWSGSTSGSSGFAATRRTPGVSFLLRGFSSTL